MQSAFHRPSLAGLFVSFLRLGVTAFGGPAMVAYIHKMAVERKGWLDEASFRDGVALCQTIPGATAMQTSAYVGFRARGVAGAAASFIGFSIPAFSFMMALSALYVGMRSLPPVVSAFSGLQAMVVAIVANATLSFGRTSLKNPVGVLIAVLAAGLFGWRINPVIVILFATLLGLILYRQAVSIQTPDPKGCVGAKKHILWLLAIALVGFAALFLVQRRLFDLAALMVRIDLLAFGGGFASVPLMFHEVVEVRSWMDGPTFLNGIVLGQVTPGPIVITGTFVGYLLSGPLGGIVATVSVFLPSFVLVVGIAPHFDRLRASPGFNHAVGGILCSFVGLLLTVTVRFALNVPWDLPRILLACASLVALLLRADILYVVLVGVVISVMVL